MKVFMKFRKYIFNLQQLENNWSKNGNQLSLYPMNGPSMCLLNTMYKLYSEILSKNWYMYLKKTMGYLLNIKVLSPVSGAYKSKSIYLDWQDTKKKQNLFIS